MSKLTLDDLTSALKEAGIIYHDYGKWINGFVEWADLTEYLGDALDILNRRLESSHPVKECCGIIADSDNKKGEYEYDPHPNVCRTGGSTSS